MKQILSYRTLTIKIIASLLVLSFCAFISACMQTAPESSDLPRTYYVDSQNGNDKNHGLSPEKAIRTLEKANSLTLKGGDSLLFKADCTYEGNLAPVRERDGSLITIGRYGDGEDPVISASGDNALTLCDFDFVKVSEITFTNENGVCGIYISNASGGALKGIHIKNCSVDKVNVPRNTYKYESGGIICAAFSEEAPGWFEDLLIENNTITNVARSGIFLTGLWGNRPEKGWGKNEYVSDGENWWPHKDVVIKGNYIDEVGGDGIVVIGTEGTLIEHNTVYRINTNPVTPCANAGIWPQSSNNCIIQYNEVAYANKPKDCADAQAFDVDAACRNTVIQYNYSHDNKGGFLLLCESDNIKDEHGFRGTVVRNNISVNDGEGELMALVGPVRGALIENNTFITSDWVMRLINVWTEDNQNQAKDVKVRKNIFISNGADNDFNLENGEDFVFEGNLYWGAHRTPREDEVSPIIADPLIETPEKAYEGFESVSKYIPKEGSPTYNSDILPLCPAGEDILNNKTDGAPYVGAIFQREN